MRSWTGLVAGIAAAAAFSFAYWQAVKPGAGWMDAQWLFIAALPYNWATLRLAGESNFTPDAPAQVFAALICDIVFAYIVGALFGALIMGALRLAGLRRPA